MILMREHDSVLILVLTFAGVLMLINFLRSGSLYIKPFWIFAVIFYFIIWCVLKYIKKYRKIIVDIFEKHKLIKI